MVSRREPPFDLRGRKPRNVHELGRECNTVIYEA